MNLKTAVILWLALVAVIASLFCNPWGSELVHFLIQSVLWLRPEIEEWNPTPLGWDHAAAFMLIGLGGLAWILTRRRRMWWEYLVFAAFTVLALRSIRNTPLFALIALAVVPQHLASAIARFRDRFRGWELFFREEQNQKMAGVLFIALSVCIGIGTLTLHKEDPFTMSVPRAEYPVAAMRFIREHELRGKLVPFFDWGEMAIFHLFPECPPSIDPRLDTCYPRELIAAHWKFYNDEPFDEKIFDPYDADLALLPVKQAGALTLSHHAGWKPVYYDDTAVLLVRDPDRFPKLKGLELPVAGPKAAALGQARFGELN